MHYTISYARTHLSRLIREAEAGEEVIVLRGTKPIVRIIPIGNSKVENQAHRGAEGTIEADAASEPGT